MERQQPFSSIWPKARSRQQQAGQTKIGIAEQRGINHVGGHLAVQIKPPALCPQVTQIGLQINAALIAQQHIEQSQAVRKTAQSGLFIKQQQQINGVGNSQPKPNKMQVFFHQTPAFIFGNFSSRRWALLPACARQNVCNAQDRPRPRFSRPRAWLGPGAQAAITRYRPAARGL